MRPWTPGRGLVGPSRSVSDWACAEPRRHRQPVMLTSARLMFMAVVDVGIMRVRMFEPFVLVFMGVPNARGHRMIMRVLMMFVVRVRVRVSHFLVHVQVFVALGDVQPHADSHQS